MSTEIDLRGFKCPIPQMKTRKALKTVGIGERITVIVDKDAVVDIRSLARSSKHIMISEVVHDRYASFVIERAS